jgi:hypothetical protein
MLVYEKARKERSIVWLMTYGSFLCLETNSPENKRSRATDSAPRVDKFGALLA